MGQLFNQKGKKGLKIIAEGDSWFDYPRITGVRNIIVHLENIGYEIENISTVGHTVIDMVYGTIINRKHDYVENQQINYTLEKVSKVQPDIILFSGGGNDIAGDELASFLNHSKSGLPILREESFSYMINFVLKKAYEDFFAKVRLIKNDIHFILHGYGNPPVNGDGVGLDLKGFPMPGPWLKPAFSRNGHIDRQRNEEVMRLIMNYFNDMLRTLAEDPHVHYIDLRPHIRYTDWVNELHLKDAAYKKVAQQFDAAIQTI
jgi:hypothetical protein